MNKYIQEINDSLLKIKPYYDPKLKARYEGAIHPKRKPNEQSNLSFYGLSAPQTKVLADKNFSFKKLPDDKLLKVWKSIWEESKLAEIKSIALYYLDNYHKKNLVDWSYLSSYLDQVDCWTHSDGLSSIYASVLEQKPKLIKDYERWNKSNNPWKRRQSLVGLYYYARLRKSFIDPKIALKLVDNLIDDPHYYIQKGLGWTLREIYQVDPKLQVAYAKKNIGQIHSAALFATVEKYPLKLKEEFRKLRKASALNRIINL